MNAPSTARPMSLAARSRRLRLPLLIAVAGLFASGVSIASESTGPSIRLWHGESQQFGRPGMAQNWANILGTVTDPDGVASLTYSLNSGSSQPLALGPDLRRLAGPGDFNADIEIGRLTPGSNTVVLTATDKLGNSSSTTVSLTFHNDTSWPLPYAIDWSSVSALQHVAQEVDGVWSISNAGVRSTQVAYDRVLAIGDHTWTEYEITVPVTVHAIDASSFGSPISVGPGLGIALRWPGHTDWGTRVEGPWQPVIGWEPYGGKWWYEFFSDGKGRFSLQGDNGLRKRDASGMQLRIGTTYMTRTRVENASGLLRGGLYRFKIWESGTDEPAEWLMVGHEGRRDLPGGSLILIAHHVDVSFGNLTVVPRDQFSPAPTVFTWDMPIVLLAGVLAAGLVGAIGLRILLRKRRRGQPAR